MLLCRQPACKAICDSRGREHGELHVDELKDQYPWSLDADDALFRSPANKAALHNPLYVSQADRVLVDASLADDDDRGIDERFHEVRHLLVEKPRQSVGGVFYAGQWLGGARHGCGRLERPGWGCYNGQFVTNKATGTGYFTKTNGDIYDGQWLHDRAHGCGTYKHSSGSNYRGQWESDFKSGKGFEEWPDGSTYDGEFALGKKQGYGTYHASDRALFEGQFREDVMDGIGRYTFEDGRVYDGQWRMCRMTGEGRMEWPDGRVYDGQFEADKKSGLGRLSWPDGRVYEGQWWRGKQHGQGTCIDKRGRQLPGHWRDGKKTDTGTPRAHRQDSIIQAAMLVPFETSFSTTARQTEKSVRDLDLDEARTSDGCLDRALGDDDARVVDIDGRDSVDTDLVDQEQLPRTQPIRESSQWSEAI